MCNLYNNKKLPPFLRALSLLIRKDPTPKGGTQLYLTASLMVIIVKFRFVKLMDLEMPICGHQPFDGSQFKMFSLQLGTLLL